MITIDDLQRMKEQCAIGKLFEVEEETKLKNELKMKSQARVKNWPNTIEALRFKRQEEKMKKLEDDEVRVLFMSNGMVD